MTKQSKGRRAVVAKKNDNRQIWLIVVPALAFFIKMIVMSNTVQGGWLGADGENYLSAVDGLKADGFFSEVRNLHYWPAGYSIFIWLLVKIAAGNFLYLLSITQGLLFAYATYFFTKQLLSSRIAFLAVVVSFFISFNPTLSLSSNVVGYETPAAALLLISIALLIKDKLENPLGYSKKLVALSALAIGLSCFFQPRNILFGIAIFFIYFLTLAGKKSKIQFAAISIVVLMLFPAALMGRNIGAINSATISTNLGTTMFIGIGDGATGGYNGKYNGVPCPASEKGTEAEVDSAKVKCALIWYVKNPDKTAVLAAKKTAFFWSPWFGPVANGTMARNPWLKINPVKTGIKTQENYDFVFGGFGKTVSWLWVVGQLVLLFSGLIWLWKMGGNEKLLAKLAGAPVILGWLISMGTIGDHRFRLPQMGLSLFLQVVGFYALRKRLSVATISPALEGSTKAR
jgi:hypothetical protein